MTRRQLWDTIVHSAAQQYEPREARAITARLCETLFGIRFTDVVIEPEAPYPLRDETKLEQVLKELQTGRPVQYIIGHTFFCGLRIQVREGVLIPRPETEELVEWIAESISDPFPRILDVGTGSGAIALALAAKLPSAQISGIDLSPEALQIARENATLNRLNVHFEQTDILRQTPPDLYTILVSNPPYVTRSEASQMALHVLNYEPHLALFVEDDDPLLFYRVLAEKGRRMLVPGGHIYVEINERFGGETLQLFNEQGYTNSELRLDSFGKPRMIRAQKP